MYFADINVESANFIQIQECLEFGDGNGPGVLFPANQKYMDWQIPRDRVERYYDLIVTNLAAQTAWYEGVKESALGDSIRRVFPDEPLLKLSAFPQSGHWCLRWLLFWVGRTVMFFGVNFIKEYVHALTPPEIRDPENLATFQSEFLECLYYFPEIMSYIASRKHDYFAYAHPNLNVDNAFFYRADDGEAIECGGLDWGQYGGVSVPILLSGAIANAEEDFYQERHEHLVRLYCQEFTARSRVALDADQVLRSLDGCSAADQ